MQNWLEKIYYNYNEDIGIVIKKYGLPTIFIFCYILFFSSKLSAKSIVVFRNDDLSANSDPIFEYKVLQIFRKYDIKPLFAIIPVLGGNEIERGLPITDSLKSWYTKGWIDLAMHGYNHERNQKSGTEFRGISYKEQCAKIKKGKKILQEALEININIFCPPWNAIDYNTLKALKSNNINILSSYLGEKYKNGIKYLNCNCNLMEGPLGALSDKIHLSIDTKNDVLLFALYHTSYDFNIKSFEKLDSLINYINSLENVKISSFSQLLNNQSYSEILTRSNIAGHQLKYLQYNKYIRKIILKIPLISNYVIKQTKFAETYYWTGNYIGVNQIYRGLMIRLWMIVSVILIVTIILFYTLYTRKMSKDKI